MVLLVLWILVSGDIVKDIVEGEKLLVEGCYWVFKLKIGVCEFVIDLCYICVIVEVLGDCVSICVDVNQVWDVVIGVKGCCELVVMGVDFIEQLVSVYDNVVLVWLSQ